MRSFNAQRIPTTPDEIWLLEHPPVYTLGLNGDPRHLIHPTSVPLIKTDRGGQITWHGPGQLVAYLLIDLRRLNIGVKQMVMRLEAAVIGLLASYGLAAHTRDGAPGVYIGNAKIASVGLKISRGCSYHGISLNVNPDLAYFSFINPCGYAGQTVTSLEAHGILGRSAEFTPALAAHLIQSLTCLDQSVGTCS